MYVVPSCGQINVCRLVKWGFKKMLVRPPTTTLRYQLHACAESGGLLTLNSTNRNARFVYPGSAIRL